MKGKVEFIAERLALRQEDVPNAVIHANSVLYYIKKLAPTFISLDFGEVRRCMTMIDIHLQAIERLQRMQREVRKREHSNRLH
ncbi:hypothetical protein [Mangrovibacillus cuniculi]|uniref:Uncharacterized protein n=1 Tax=Mangrovibacillus cuniculi TaxID=2593652 RepID=A0A7S8HFS7_9BACI|nr:hypothetical protein [Mangrovibacillus cuniculi]QPC47138.1 hypothetical protein G8O30_09245 [Mangrovibacillus cuniculi]QPC48511.1 hypothetical protein G8O30_16020 [Mangrovibacillus cuniculi]